MPQTSCILESTRSAALRRAIAKTTRLAGDWVAQRLTCRFGAVVCCASSLALIFPLTLTSTSVGK